MDELDLNLKTAKQNEKRNVVVAKYKLVKNNFAAWYKLNEIRQSHPHRPSRFVMGQTNIDLLEYCLFWTQSLTLAFFDVKEVTGRLPHDVYLVPPGQHSCTTPQTWPRRVLVTVGFKT